MEIQRIIKQDMLKRLMGDHDRKVIVLYGARQVGKTTLCQELIKETGYKTLAISADEQKYIDVLSSRDAGKLGNLVTGYELLFIDEAQRVPDIGINLKILIDQFPGLRILVTGSSAFELANRVSEPLTGRKFVYHLYPIATGELGLKLNKFELDQQLEDRLVCGSYPEIFSIVGATDKARYLATITSDYLYKDILEMGSVRNPDKLRKLLRLLAWQIGREVSLGELAAQLEMNKETVANYIDLLEKSFVLFRLGGFGKNLRNEVTRTNKYYFYDLGVRNAVIDDFKSFADRSDQDRGHMWENFLIIERLKMLQYAGQLTKSYFWRTYAKSEIDYIEEGGIEIGKPTLSAFELKLRKAPSKAPKSWREGYPDASWQAVNRENWLGFVK